MESTSNCSFLNSNGYPKNPSRIYIAVSRSRLPPSSMIYDAYLHGYEISIPVRRFGRYEYLFGSITKAQRFSDGVVAHFPQNEQISFLKWNNAILWIPKSGSAGILG